MPCSDAPIKSMSSAGARLSWSMAMQPSLIELVTELTPSTERSRSMRSLRHSEQFAPSTRNSVRIQTTFGACLDQIDACTADRAYEPWN